MGDIGERLFDGNSKVCECGMISTVECSAFRKLPRSFNEVEIRRVGWQEHQTDSQLLGEPHHDRISLVAGVVEHQRDRRAVFTSLSSLLICFVNSWSFDTSSIGRANELAAGSRNAQVDFLKHATSNFQ